MRTNHYLLFLVFTTFQSLAKPETPIASLTSDLCDQNLVVLGELPSHGEAVGFQIKADLVKKLVEDCGFHSIYFEAPVYDFLGFQKSIKENRASQEQLNNAIGGFWNTLELEPWRHWLSTTAINGKLNIAGLDDQISRSSNYAKKVLPQWTKEILMGENGESCYQSIDRNLHWKYNSKHSYNEAEKQKLYNCAAAAVEMLKNSAEENSHQLKMLENFSNQYLRSLNYTEALTRDEQMFKNFQWQSQSKPHKSIIWTATVHAAKTQGPLGFKPLGAWLNENYKDKMSSVGLTAYKGQSSMAGRPPKQIPEAGLDTLEAQVLKSGSDWMTLNSNQLRELKDASSRLFGRFTENNWIDFFDIVIVVKKEQAPKFEN